MSIKSSPLVHADYKKVYVFKKWWKSQMERVKLVIMFWLLNLQKLAMEEYFFGNLIHVFGIGYIRNCLSKRIKWKLLYK